MRKTVASLALAAGLGAVGAPRTAHALGPVDLEIGARVGGATNPFPSPNPNPLGFGLGARAGVSFVGFYGGLSFMYYFGSSQAIPGLPGSSISENAVLYGVEGGFNASLLGLATLRAQLGVGNFQINVSGTEGSSNAGHLYLEPAAVLIIPIAAFFIGADVSVLVLPDVADPSGVNGSSWQAAFTAHGQAGFKF